MKSTSRNQLDSSPYCIIQEISSACTATRRANRTSARLLTYTLCGFILRALTRPQGNTSCTLGSLPKRLRSPVHFSRLGRLESKCSVLLCVSSGRGTFFCMLEHVSYISGPSSSTVSQYSSRASRGGLSSLNPHIQPASRLFFRRQKSAEADKQRICLQDQAGSTASEFV